VVTAAVWDRMRASATITPRRSTNGQADHTEIYLPEQVLAVFHRDRPVVISHMSSGELDADGEPAEWCELVTVDTDERGIALEEPVERDICERSKTPAGVFDYYRRIEGIRNGALGSMWNPVYFNYGIAVHGAINVPPAPASHGCVRIPMHIADYFQDLVDNGWWLTATTRPERPSGLRSRSVDRMGGLQLTPRRDDQSVGSDLTRPSSSTIISPRSGHVASSSGRRRSSESTAGLKLS
jgi:hypothetical protein